MKRMIIATVVAIVSISPAIATVMLASPVCAQADGQWDIVERQGDTIFINDGWEVIVNRHGGRGSRYTYSSRQNGKPGISLNGGRLNRSGGKHYYTWNNQGTIYQITWQPQDPKYARVRVIDPRGREIFNKLMWTPPEI